MSTNYRVSINQLLQLTVFFQNKYFNAINHWCILLRWCSCIWCFV